MATTPTKLVQVAYPTHTHVLVQRQLRRLLENAAGDSGVVEKEIPYRPLAEHECWCADVAYVSRFRWESIDLCLNGAPELVAEVLAPSNSAFEMLNKEEICLQNGSREFWMLDTNRRQIKVSSPGKFVFYSSGQRIPLFFAPGVTISVDEIFA